MKRLPVHREDIRLLDAGDAAIYQRLRLYGLHESPTAFGSSPADEEGRSLPEIEARVTPATDGSRCIFGAFADGQLVGVLAFIRSPRQKLSHGAELCGMYVDPQFRRGGFGGALIDAAIAHARTLQGMRQLTLEVNAENIAARSLYRSRGFVCIGLEPGALCVEGRYYDEECYLLRLVDVA